MITVTDSAVKQLRNKLEEKDASLETDGLRLGVSKGGCAGMQYTMEITTGQSGDEVLVFDGVRIFVDKESEPWLRGSEVDFEDALNDSGFRIHNPNAARSCGCGTSFEAVGEEGTYDPADDCK